MTHAAKILTLARARRLHIATAESCTGGMVAAALTDIAGSSDVFDRGYVTYSNSAKRAMLGVQDKTLTRYGAVSEQVALEMAEGALNRAVVDLAIAITGIAGPGGSEHKPEGRVCFALARSDKPTRTETVEFGAVGRAEVRQSSTDHALKMLLAALS